MPLCTTCGACYRSTGDVVHTFVHVTLELWLHCGCHPAGFITIRHDAHNMGAQRTSCRLMCCRPYLCKRRSRCSHGEMCRDGCTDVVQEQSGPGAQWSNVFQLLQCLQAEGALSVYLAADVSEHIVANLRQLLSEDSYAQLQRYISDQRGSADLQLAMWLQQVVGNPEVTMGLLQTLLGLAGLLAPLMPTVQHAGDSLLLHDDRTKVCKPWPLSRSASNWRRMTWILVRWSTWV